MEMINTYDSLPLAYIDKGMLESNGIPAVVQADALSQIFPGPAGAGLGTIKLFVPEKDMAIASSLLFPDCEAKKD